MKNSVFEIKYRICLFVLLTFPRQSIGVERVVLLRNGNVLSGDVQQLAEHVTLRSANSHVRIPEEQVELVAGSLSKVYEFKAKRTSRRPSARESLIHWCLQHDLLAEARRELNLLRRDHAAYANLDLLERKVRRGSESSKTVLPAQSPIHPDLQFAKDKLGGLSKVAVRDFVRSTQPLLLNRCALAGCHGAAPKSRYQLLGQRRSLVPLNLTHRNLGATLRQLDGPATQSPLWMSASQPHGGANEMLSEAEQAKLLSWIRLISKDVSNLQSDSRVRLATGELSADGSDPFDPAEFNSLDAESGQ